MSKKEMIERLQAKTPEQKFMQIMREDFQCAPKVAEAILQEAQECLQGQSGQLRPGQMRKVLVRRKSRHGQALKDAPTVEVIWTVDAGIEDQRMLEKHGCQALRRRRIRRLLEEAIEQEGVATQEDLAQVLSVSVRTIKRDFAEMQAQGAYLPSRGNLQGIGRGQTHKAQIIKRWLQGETYDQLVLSTRHCVTSIRRYIRTFLQVTQLHRQGMHPEQIALVLQVGQSLVREYLAVYEQNDTPQRRERLESQLQRFSRAGQAQKGAQ
jgi:hypothetical protein